MADTESPNAEYYRKKADEIRRAAGRATNDEVAHELFEIVEWFDRMTHHVERPLERHYFRESLQFLNDWRKLSLNLY
jgi:hypothetical protein